MTVKKMTFLNMLKEITENKDIDIRRKFKNHIDSHGIKKSFIARELNVTPTHFNYILIQERDLTERNRAIMNQYLGTNF